MSPERKKEMDMILRKTEEEMKREDFDPMKAGIPLDEFLERQQKRRIHDIVVYNLVKLVRMQLIKSQCFSMREAKYSWTEDKDEKGNQIYREPDFSILCGVQKRDNSTYTDVPRFIAEILSDSTEEDDRGEKMNLYLKVGVEEIWLIDPGILTIERYILDDDGKSFLLHDIIKKTDDDKTRNNIRPLLFPHLLIPYDDIFMGVSVDQ